MQVSCASQAEQSSGCNQCTSGAMKRQKNFWQNWDINQKILRRKAPVSSLQIKDYKKLAEELGIGEITLRDIVKELEKPARDPRDEMPKPILRTDVLI